WISRIRRELVHRRAVSDPRLAAAVVTHSDPEQGIEVRDAAAAMMAQLAPQERAAVVLKEVFELSLEETAAILGTSIGAVKAALHRGRTRLQAGADAHPRNEVSAAVVARFVECFNARDREGLLALMLDSASINMPGVDYEIGRDGFTREPSWLYYNLFDKR